MRRVVTDELQRPRVVARDEFEGRVRLNRIGEVDEVAVAHGSDRALGERGRDRFGDVEAGDARLIGALRAVGKGHVDHQGSLCSLADTNRRKRRTAGYKRSARDRQWDRVLAMTEETLVRRVVVEGFVQGVGYRDFARHAALRLGVSGWVRNRSDGTVEALIAG